jgi:hypothetical protein
MSTVMHAFRASSEDNLHEQIGIAKFLARDIVPFLEREGVEFQVFRSSTGIIYRVLEMGYGMKNKMWKYPQWFPQCNYDNRSDIPEEDLPNKVIADEINRMIVTGQSYIEIIVPKKEVIDETNQNANEEQ